MSGRQKFQVCVFNVIIDKLVAELDRRYNCLVFGSATCKSPLRIRSNSVLHDSVTHPVRS